MKKNFDINSLSESESWLILFLLSLDKEKEAHALVQDFENNLIYKNRFSSKHRVVSELQECASLATMVVSKGAIYYRARIFHNSIVDNLLKYYLVERGSSPEEIEEILKKWDAGHKEFLISSLAFHDDSDNAKVFYNRQAFNVAVSKWRKHTRFKGYNAKESTAPSADKTYDGRANPDHIRYLYLCEDSLTPAYEIRAVIGDQLSLAKLKLLQDIKIFNLSKDITSGSGVENRTPFLFDAISDLFSRPYNGKRENYIATQYLAESIKNMGFDGLRFESSLHRGGYNTVLFNPEVCRVISSDIVCIDNIEIKTSSPWSYALDKEP